MFFLNTYGSPLLQAMVGLRTDETSVSRRIGRDGVREATAKQAATHLEQQIDQGGVIEAAVRALIYVRFPEGKVDEHGFAALKQISAELTAKRMAWSGLNCSTSRSTSQPSPGNRQRRSKQMSTHYPGRERYTRLLHAAQALPPVTTAVAHPCDRVSLEGVIEAARLGLIKPILVVSPTRIQPVATELGLDIARYPLVEAAHGHDSAAKAVELVRQGKAEALMKGSLRTDELIGAVVARDTGVRTARRISHCFVMDVPGHDSLPDHHRCRCQYRARSRRQGRYCAECDRPRPCIAVRGGSGCNPVSNGDHQPQGAIDGRSRSLVHNGRSRSDHRRRARRLARPR